MCEHHSTGKVDTVCSDKSRQGKTCPAAGSCSSHETDPRTVRIDSRYDFVCAASGHWLAGRADAVLQPTEDKVDNDKTISLGLQTD